MEGKGQISSFIIYRRQKIPESEFILIWSTIAEEDMDSLNDIIFWREINQIHSKEKAIHDKLRHIQDIESKTFRVIVAIVEAIDKIVRAGFNECDIDDVDKDDFVIKDEKPAREEEDLKKQRAIEKANEDKLKFEELMIQKDIQNRIKSRKEQKSLKKLQKKEKAKRIKQKKADKETARLRHPVNRINDYFEKNSGSKKPKEGSSDKTLEENNREKEIQEEWEKGGKVCPNTDEEDIEEEYEEGEEENWSSTDEEEMKEEIQEQPLLTPPRTYKSAQMERVARDHALCEKYGLT